MQLLLPWLAVERLLPLADVNSIIYWRDLPILIVVVSLVYGATRFDDWEHIVRESLRWMLRLTTFLALVMFVLYVLARVFI
jgi:hypothetical protein